jgi:TP901 family phage tail tape measure protein
MAIEAARLFVKVGSDTREGEAGLNSFNDRLNAAARNLTMTGGLMSASLTLPLVAAGKAALATAADFERSMNVLQQVSGASAEQMSALNAQALELGAATSFSAGEAASAMLELGKAGMGVESIMASIGGVMDLAAAGGIGLATAANVTASALNAFGLQAEQSTYVANLLAAAANASAADISDLAAGLQQGGFAFAATGQNIDDLVASLAILTNVGLTGSDAGTALKNAMTRLMAPTAEASELMASLGINVFDAQGNMLPLANVLGVVNAATANMSMQERNAALATIFLSDGMKAMIPLLEVGQDGFLEMKDAVNEEGAAARVADARMAGLAGSIEYFKGSVDSFMISTAMPYLNMLGGMVRGGADLITRFGQMSPAVRNASLAFLGILAAAGPVVATLGAVAGAAAFLLSPLGMMVAASSLLAAAWAGDFWGIRDVTSDVFASITDTIAGWWGQAEPYVSAARAAFGVLWAGLTGEGDVATVMANLDTISAVFGPELANQISDAGLALNGFVTTAKSVDFGELWGGATSIAQKFTGQVAAQLGLEVDWSELRVNAGGMVTRAGERLSEVDWSQMSVNAVGMAWRAGQQLTQVNWTEMGVNAIGMVTRAGEQLSIVDWSQMAVSFGGLVATAGDKLTEQADRYLGEGSIITRTVERMRGTMAALQGLADGASLDDPLDLLNRAVTGAISIANLVGSVKADVTTTAFGAATDILTQVLAFSKDLVAGVNPEQVAKAATGLVDGFVNQIVALTAPDQLGDVGAAAGGLVSEFLTQLGNVLGTPEFGSDVGKAVGSGVAAMTTGALALAAGIAGELANVPFSDLVDQLRDFTSGFILGAAGEIAKGDYAPLAHAILTGLGTALWNLIEANPLAFWNLADTEITLNSGETVNPWQDFDEASPTWEQVGQSLSAGFNDSLTKLLDLYMGTGPTKGPDPILSQHEDLLGQQRERERAAEMGQVFGASGLDALLAFLWPELPTMKWPEIPVPQWWSDLLEWSGLAQESAQRSADILDEILSISFDRGGGGGGGGSDDQGGNGGGGGNGGVDPDQNNFPDGLPGETVTAAAIVGGPTIQITGPIYITNGMDIEELSYEIIQRVRRGL